MKTYLKLSFWTAILLTFIGAYILASGRPLLISESGHLVTDLKQSYLPFFKLALSGFIFCALLKLYIDFRKTKNNNSVN